MHYVIFGLADAIYLVSKEATAEFQLLLEGGIGAAEAGVITQVRSHSPASLLHLAFPPAISLLVGKVWAG